MIKSVSVEGEHLQECGERTDREETRVRENRDLLQCFNQEIKVCSKLQQIFVFNLAIALCGSVGLLRSQHCKS